MLSSYFKPDFLVLARKIHKSQQPILASLTMAEEGKRKKRMKDQSITSCLQFEKYAVGEIVEVKFEITSVDEVSKAKVKKQVWWQGKVIELSRPLRKGSIVCL